MRNFILTVDVKFDIWAHKKRKDPKNLKRIKDMSTKNAQKSLNRSVFESYLMRVRI